MTLAQSTFAALAGGGTILLTFYFYPGVKNYAEEPRDALLASSMAAALCATSLALAVSVLVNAAVWYLG